MRINLKKFHFTRETALLFYVAVFIFSDKPVTVYPCALLYLFMEGYSILGGTDRKRKISAFDTHYFCVILYFFLAALTGHAIYPRVSYNRCLVMFANFVIAFFAEKHFRNFDFRNTYFKFIIWLTVIYELYMIFSSGSNVFRGRLGDYAHSFFVIGGKYNANGVGITLLYAMVFAFFFLLEKNKKIYIPICLMFLCGIVLTGSRKAILCAMVVIGAYPLLMISQKLTRKNLIKFFLFFLVAMVLLIGVLYLMFSVPSLYAIAGNRIEAMIVKSTTGAVVDSSMRYRTQFIDLAKKLFMEHPIFGIGIDNFAQVNPIKGYYSHCNYWEILSGGGIIGGVLYFSLYIRIFVTLLRSLKRKKEHAMPLILSFLITVIMDYYNVSYLEKRVVMDMFLMYSAGEKKIYRHSWYH